MNNLSLPPPVISLTEKKKLLAKKPNSTSNKNENTPNNTNSLNSSLNENEIIDLLSCLVKKSNEAEKANVNISGNFKPFK